MISPVYNFRPVLLPNFSNNGKKDSLFSAKVEGELASLNTSRPQLVAKAAISMREWLKQFQTEEDRLIALEILKNIKYVTFDKARKYFHSAYQTLKGKKDFDIKETKISFLGVGKSGGIAGYIFRQANDFRSKGPMKYAHTFGPSNNFDPFIDFSQLNNSSYMKEQLNKGIKNIVLVDDMIGDGGSFIEYLTPELLENLEKFKIYYVTLIKDTSKQLNGMEVIKNKYPKLNIEFISGDDIKKYNSQDNKVFSEEMKLKIKKFIDKYNNFISEKKMDRYKKSKLFLLFDWNSPGQLPMPFSLSVAGHWKALFPRHNGIFKHSLSEKQLSA